MAGCRAPSAAQACGKSSSVSKRFSLPLKSQVSVLHIFHLVCFLTLAFPGCARSLQQVHILCLFCCLSLQRQKIVQFPTFRLNQYPSSLDAYPVFRAFSYHRINHAHFDFLFRCSRIIVKTLLQVHHPVQLCTAAVQVCPADCAISVQSTHILQPFSQASFVVGQCASTRCSAWKSEQARQLDIAAVRRHHLPVP